MFKISSRGIKMDTLVWSKSIHEKNWYLSRLKLSKKTTLGNFMMYLLYINLVC